MEHKKTIMIFGISSFIGSNLAEQLKDDYRIVGTYHETPIHLPGILTLRCDVHQKDMVQKMVFIFKPDITIYAVGLTDLEACQEFPKVADALNTAGVFNVSSASERYGSKFIFFSSSYIFSGEDTVFKENDTPMPSSVYGNNIASSEFYIQKSCLNYIIFRCCPIYGRSYNPNSLKWMEVLDRCNFTNQRIVCDTKIFTGYMDIWSLVEIVKIAIENNITNKLFQVSSSDLMNRYEFSKKYCEAFNANTALLAKGDWKFPRTENQIALQGLGEELFFKMDTSNVETTLNISVPTIEQTINNVHQKLSGSYGSQGKTKSAGITFI